MKKLFSVVLFTILLAISLTAGAQWNYPPSPVSDSTETYFGTVIQDPYQWLENMEDPFVEKWFRSQADFTTGVLNTIPNKDAIISELAEMDNVKEVYYSNINERIGKYFYNKRYKGEESGKLYYRASSDGEDILLFDPLKYEEGTAYTLGRWSVSHNGKRILIEITEKGKELSFLKVMEVDSKTFLPLELRAAGISSWLQNSDTKFLYSKSMSEDVHKMESRLDGETRLHVIGADGSEDKVILSRVNNPELGFLPEEFPYIFFYDDSDWMFAGKGSVDNNQELFVAPKSQLESGNIQWKPFCKRGDQFTSVVAHGDYAYVLTPKHGSNYSIMKISLKDADPSVAGVIFSGGDNKIESISRSKNFLLIRQRHNTLNNKMLKYGLADGKIAPVDITLEGTISARPVSPQSDICMVSVSNWTIPSNIFELDLNSGKFGKCAFTIDFEYPGLSDLVSEQLEIASHDGTLVPLSLIYDKTTYKKDGNAMCFISGYGSYGISSNPGFNPSRMSMLKRGVLVAIAHVRGGGEKGKDWHLGGMKTTKPNTWKDFIACTEYLINNGYASKDRIACTGGSAGGILVGRAVTERPDLFRAAVPTVGSMNPLRMEFSPNGPGNIPEFGTVNIEEEFRALMEMDSYHNTEKGEKYPAFLITTGFNDPRVISWVPAKFAAKMQAFNGSANPVLLRVDYKTGHFGGETTSERFRNTADIYAFVLWQCGHPDFQPGSN